jgi:hypothetical protein
VGRLRGGEISPQTRTCRGLARQSRRPSRSRDAPRGVSTGGGAPTSLQPNLCIRGWAQAPGREAENGPSPEATPTALGQSSTADSPGSSAERVRRAGRRSPSLPRWSSPVTGWLRKAAERLRKIAEWLPRVAERPPKAAERPRETAERPRKVAAGPRSRGEALTRRADSSRRAPAPFPKLPAALRNLLWTHRNVQGPRGTLRGRLRAGRSARHEHPRHLHFLP